MTVRNDTGATEGGEISILFVEMDANYRSVRAYAVECIRYALATVHAGKELDEEQRQRGNQVNTFGVHMAEEAMFANDMGQQTLIRSERASNKNRLR